MRRGYLFGKSPYFVHFISPTIFSSVGGMSQLVFQIPRTDVIFMGHFIKGQVRTMFRIVRYIVSPRTGIIEPRRILILQSKIFLKIQLENISTIYLPSEFRGIVGGLGGTLW